MRTHTWTYRILPPFVFVGVVGCVWYGIAAIPKTAVLLPSPQQVSAAPAETTQPTIAADQQPLADISPAVSKLGDNHVRFSIDAKSFAKVQKVEFYIENKLVGAAFASPYAVTVSQDNFTAGVHTVTAKVYTDTHTQQTIPALFTATPKTAPPASTDIDENTPPASAQPTTVTLLPKPTDVAASLDPSGTSVNISWSNVAGASGYQIWRDGSQIGTSIDPVFADTNLTSGQTYNYQLVATADPDGLSDPSDPAAVTVPVADQTDATKPGEQDSMLASPGSNQNELAAE